MCTIDQISDDPALRLEDTEILTEKDRDLVTTAVVESYASGQISTESQDILEQIATQAAAKAAAEQLVREYTDRRDALIRSALHTELPRTRIAAAAGVLVARIYQIRDGRR